MPLTALIIVGGVAIVLRQHAASPPTSASQPSVDRPATAPRPESIAASGQEASPATLGLPAPGLPPAPIAPQPMAAAPSPTAITSLADLVSRCTPAVVTIEAGARLGTGFFVAPNRLVTNQHVVAESTFVTLRLATGQQSRGHVVGRSLEVDLALVESDTPYTGTPLVLRPLAGVRTGEEVIAIGSPAVGRSALESSVTRGIISGIRSMNGVMVLQTDAALNPGNSGGPLVDALGRVVGINSIRATQQQSIGFALASDYAQALLEGRPVAATAAAQALPSAQASRVTSVPAPPAAPSESDVEREAGTRQFEAEMAAFAPQAAKFVAAVGDYRDSCMAQRRGQSWQVVADAIATDTPVSRDCASARSQIVRFRSEATKALGEVFEQARRAGVYPGTVRAIMEKHGVYWDGWEK